MKKFFLLAGMLLLLAACAEDKSSGTGSNSYQITGKVIYTADNFKSAKICVDANNNGLADDTYCTETAVDGSYSFTSNNSTNNYPLVASITTANTAVNARLNNGKILMYAPKGKADVISIETTLIKSIMEQNSTKTYDMANTEVTALIKKADNKTLFTVYTNALNSADIQNWESSIRGIVGAVTNKLLESTEITADTIITVTQEEVDNINNIIKEEDNNEPQQPENPGTEPTTPLEKVTYLFNNAVIKADINNPIDLIAFHEPKLDEPHNKIFGINKDTFGIWQYEEMNPAGVDFMLSTAVKYKEEYWDPNTTSKLIASDGYGGYNGLGYLFYYEDEENICSVGQYKSIFYKLMYNVPLEEATQICDYRDYPENPTEEELNAFINEVTSCFYNAFKNEKIYFEKYYYTIDTTQLSECKQSLTPLEKITEILAGAEIKNSAENPVNLNEHLDRTLIHHNQSSEITNFIGIKYDTFGEFSESPTFTNANATMKDLNYKENNWPSDSSLHFEVFPDSNSSTTGQNGYFFSNHYYKYQYESGNFIADNICSANGKVNGIFYKPIVSDTEMAAMQSDGMQCLQNSGINIDENGQISQDDIDKMLVCFADIWFQHKNNYKIEKWYWTIDTTQLEECK